MRQTSAASGALVVDAATGAVRYSLRPATRRMPASVEKLWTTSTALRRLGPSRQFPTRVYAKAAIDDAGRLNGNLYLKGGGDPTLGTYGMRALARALAAAGVKRVTGGVVGDESMFDGVRGVPPPHGGFSPALEPLSALSYRRNVY